MAIVHAINSLVGNAADRPAAAAGYKGLIFSALDTGQVSWCDGTNWFVLSVPGSTITTLFNNIDPLTTKGDLLTNDGTDSIRMAVPSDGFFRIADSSQSNGWTTARHMGSVTLLAPGAAMSYTTTAAYAPIIPVGGTNPTRIKLDLTDYDEGRIVTFGGVSTGGMSGSTKIVDIAGFDLTGTVGFNSTTRSLKVGTWTSFNAASKTDVVIEAQAIEGTGADVLEYENVHFQFRSA